MFILVSWLSFFKFKTLFVSCKYLIETTATIYWEREKNARYKWYLFVILTQYNLQEGESLCCTENAIFPLRSIFRGAYAPVHKYSARAKCATPQMLAVTSIQARTCRMLGTAQHEHHDLVDLQRHQLLQPSIGCAITSGLVASSGRCPCQLI